MTRKLGCSLNASMTYFILFFVMLLPYHSSVAGLLLNPSNNLLSVTDFPNSVDVSGIATYNSGSNLWEYRYTISETGGIDISNAQFVIKEDESHENIHDEQDILSENSNFQWDGTQRSPGAGAGSSFFSMLNNYSWFDINIVANSDILLGFDDIHGPALERWQIYLGGETPNYIQVTAQPMLLPVPSLFPLANGQNVGFGGDPVNVPEPETLLLLASGLLGLTLIRRKKSHKRNGKGQTSAVLLLC